VQIGSNTDRPSVFVLKLLQSVSKRVSVYNNKAIITGRIRAGVPNLECRHPLGCQTQIKGCRTRFREVMQKIEIWCPATFVADLNFYQL